MTANEWLPAHAPFDMVRRGYSPEQVNAHLERLEYEMRIAVADRDANSQRLAELTTQLAAAQGEADSMRSELNRMAREPLSMAGLSERMQRMIRLAEEEATDIRKRAQVDADEIRAKVTAAQEEHAAARAAFDTERERTRKQLAEQVHDLVAEATAEAETTRGDARADAERMLAEATAERDQMLAQAHSEADTALTHARTEADTTLTRARTEADRLLTETRTSTEDMRTGAAAERERLDAESLARRTQVEEDFEIAMNARRTEAHRVLTDRERESVAEAARRVREATNRAAGLVADGTAEAHRRVAAADRAVQKLFELRTELLAQLDGLADHLDHIRGLAGAAPALLNPPAGEADRPRVEDFPAITDDTPPEVSGPGTGQEPDADRSPGGLPPAQDTGGRQGTGEPERGLAQPARASSGR